MRSATTRRGGSGRRVGPGHSVQPPESAGLLTAALRARMDPPVEMDEAAAPPPRRRPGSRGYGVERPAATPWSGVPPFESATIAEATTPRVRDLDRGPAGPVATPGSSGTGAGAAELRQGGAGVGATGRPPPPRAPSRTPTPAPLHRPWRPRHPGRAGRDGELVVNGARPRCRWRRTRRRPPAPRRSRAGPRHCSRPPPCSPRPRSRRASPRPSRRRPCPPGADARANPRRRHSELRQRGSGWTVEDVRYGTQPDGDLWIVIDFSAARVSRGRRPLLRPDDARRDARGSPRVRPLGGDRRIVTNSAVTSSGSTVKLVFDLSQAVTLKNGSYTPRTRAAHTRCTSSSTSAERRPTPAVRDQRAG